MGVASAAARVCTLKYAHLHVFLGVAGVVVNEKNEFLLVQEKWLRNRSIILWKFPGGMADLGNAQTNFRFLKLMCTKK